MRIGNGAYDQDQHDVWGAVLDSVYLHTKSRDRLAERIWPILKQQVEAALEHWREPDRGIWEVRGEPEALHLVEGHVLGGARPRRAAGRAARGATSWPTRWQAAADEIHADICANGVDERGVFTQHYDTDALDASVLLMPLVRFLPPDDERVRATVLAIADELTERRPGAALPRRGDRRRPRRRGGHVHDLLVLAGVGARRDRRARPRRAALCEKLLSLRQPARPLRRGDRPATRGRHLGNFPQAFTHLALINAVMHVIRADQGLETGAFDFERELARLRAGS